MQLTLGPILFFWSRPQILQFYADMAEQPLDRVYLGETVCSKRRALSLADWLDLGRDLHNASGAQIVLSGLALIEAQSELSSLRRLCDNGEFLVEANDMAAVQYLRQKNLPFVGGPSLNVYNAHAVDELARCGMQRWTPPVECSEALIRNVIVQARQSGLSLPEIEIFVWGYLPLAYSARCFTARAENRPKDDCQFICQHYPEGLPLTSQEGQPLFTINGIQTMSGGVTNLSAEYPRLHAMGVTALRLSPRLNGMGLIVDQFDRLRRGEPPPLAVDGCNGYWHGRPGMMRVEEVGLC